MIKISSDLATFIQCCGSFREAFEDSIIEFYSGAQPSSPEAAPTGTLLAVLTKGGENFTYGSSFSLPKIVSVSVLATTGTFTITAGDASVSYTASGGDTQDVIAKALINKANRDLNFRKIAFAVYSGTGTFSVVGNSSGQDFTFSINGSLSFTAIQVPVSTNGLYFVPSETPGVLTKSSDTWSGVGLASGTVGWFRMKGKVDTFRIDGTVGTYGADITVSSASITSGVPVSVTTCAVTQALSL